MMKRARGQLIGFCLLVCLAMDCRAGAGTGVVASTNSDAEGKAAEAAVINTQATLRSNLEIQDQLHETQAAIEKIRQEAKDAEARNGEMLKMLENAISSQRAEASRDIQHSNDAIQRSNTSVLLAAGALGGFAVLVLCLAAFLLWHMVNRINAIAASLPSGQGFEAAHVPAALGMGEAQVAPSQAVERSTAQFMGVMERLEKRIHEMEAGSHNGHSLTEGAPMNGGSNGEANGESPQAIGEHAGNGGASAASEQARAVTVLLGKGQTLLKLDQAEAALGVFDEILAIEPGQTEALVKKGTALERLQKFSEAIECYDRAIAADGSMTMAYLHKGGVFNRMERYSEALECYEQALKSQDKAHPAGAMAG
jgi:tetratricopeptide (TPR) repeat protein